MERDVAWFPSLLTPRSSRGDHTAAAAHRTAFDDDADARSDPPPGPAPAWGPRAHPSVRSRRAAGNVRSCPPGGQAARGVIIARSRWWGSSVPWPVAAPQTERQEEPMPERDIQRELEEKREELREKGK